MPTQHSIIQQCMERRVLWIHDKDPKRPHIRTVSGKHSGGFFDSRRILFDDTFLEAAIGNLIEQFADACDESAEIHCVIGRDSACSGIFVKALAERLTEMKRSPCYWGIVKQHNERDKFMSNCPGNVSLKDATMIIFEDDVGYGTFDLVTMIDDVGGNLYSSEFALVNRTGRPEIGGREVFSIIENPMLRLLPGHTCPLCNIGSEVVDSPEFDPSSWNLLTGRYL